MSTEGMPRRAGAACVEVIGEKRVRAMTRTNRKSLSVDWLMAGFCLMSVFAVGPRLYAQAQTEIDNLVQQLSAEDLEATNLLGQICLRG